MSSLPADFAFSPKVWQDHMAAYFDRKLVWGAFASRVSDLESKPGTTINFPYFKAIGDVEEPGAADALQVDKLQDDSFSALVKEIGKAVGIRKSALMVSAAKQDEIFSEVQSQISRVHAEKVDKDLVAEINTVGNYINGFTSASNTELMNIRRVLQAKVTGFGDKQNDAVGIVMHSQHFLDLMSDSTSGFLQGSANDPFYNVDGFMGRLLGMALVISDTCPQLADIGGKKAYGAFILKANPYGIITKAMPEIEYDYDMLHREHVFAGTQWYGVKSFHAKINSLDLKIARMNVVTQVNA
jgi:N4-gp56 family major capsid protein